MDNTHRIQLAMDLMISIQSSSTNCLEQLILLRGTRLRAQIKPYVVESEDGFVEVADLFFEGDVSLYRVPFAAFSFVG